MAAVGSASGKLILFGEHAAVFGHAAVGARLSESTKVTIHGPSEGRWDLQEVPREDRRAVRLLLLSLEGLVPELPSSGGSAVRIESSVPRGIGMGSSAALCSAMALAALATAGEKPGSQETEAGLVRAWRLAHRLEAVFHGTPSGIDTGLSLLPGVTAFSPRPPELPVWERLSCAPLWLVMAALPRSGDCAGLVRGIGDRMRAGDRKVRQALSTLGEISSEAKQALAAGAVAAPLGKLADKAMDVLTRLGLSSPALDELLEEGRRHGALGGKLSGAGGGGAFFLVCADNASAEAAVQRLQETARQRAIRFAAPPRALCVRGISPGQKPLP